MSDRLNTRVIQVTNIAPSCTKDQLRTLFGYLGRIKELEMFPPEGAEGVVTARVGYIEFEDNVTTGVALHLSSTVFIDRAITIVPVMDGKIPDESSALQLTPSAVAGMLPGQPTWPANVVSQVTGLGANQVIMTNDPRLTSLGLPQYPPLPATTDPSKIEEIRRTVFISDLDPKVTPEMLLSFFSQTGEIKYIRMAGDENGPTRNAYIEFTDQRCIAQALSYNNVVFQGRTVSVKHATTGIVKPSPKSEASQREIDDAMKKVKEASKLISAAANSERDGSASPSRKRSKSRGRSRSHSKSKRSRSRSRGRRKRSSSRTRRRSRSRRRSPRRSRSPRRRRSRSRGRVPPTAPPVSRRRSRTRSPVRRRRSRTRSKSKPRRSRTPPKSYSRGRRSHSRTRKSRSRERKEKLKERKKSMSPPTLVREDPSAATGNGKEVSPAKGNGRSPSPAKAKKRSVTPKRKTSRSRSPNRRKRRRSTSRKRTSRSRSASRHRARKDKKRSRSRDRKHESSKKKSGRDKEEKKKESSSSKIKRDYDEEEKGFASEASEVAENSDAGGSDDSAPAPPVLEKDTDHQTVDMEMSD